MSQFKTLTQNEEGTLSYTVPTGKVWVENGNGPTRTEGHSVVPPLGGSTVVEFDSITEPSSGVVPAPMPEAHYLQYTTIGGNCPFSSVSINASEPITGIEVFGEQPVEVNLNLVFRLRNISGGEETIPGMSAHVTFRSEVLTDHSTVERMEVTLESGTVVTLGSIRFDNESSSASLPEVNFMTEIGSTGMPYILTDPVNLTVLGGITVENTSDDHFIVSNLLLSSGFNGINAWMFTLNGTTNSYMVGVKERIGTITITSVGTPIQIPVFLTVTRPSTSNETNG